MGKLVYDGAEWMRGSRVCVPAEAQRDLMAEQAAGRLRALPEVHYKS
jgi:hypothetical protein